MKALRPLISVLGLGLLAACSPPPADKDAPKAVDTPPAVDQSKQDARAAVGQEAAAAAREAAHMAGEAARKLGEAGAAAAQAVVESTEQKMRDGVEAAAAAGSEATVRDAKEAAEQAAHRIVEATRDAAQRLKEVGKGAIESVRPKMDTAVDYAEQPPAPVEERAPERPSEGEVAR